jgi:hypothetical protein
MKEIEGRRRRMSLDIGRGCVCLGGQREDLFLLASGIGVRGNNPDSFDWKEWRHLEREKKEVKYFTIKYVSEKKISHLVTYQTHALAGISLRRKEPNPHGLVSCSDVCHKK